MIEWKRFDAGYYESVDGRFHISHVWDRINGNHWEIFDSLNSRKCTGYSLKHCKQMAENDLVV